MDPSSLYLSIRTRLDLADSAYLTDDEIGLALVESYYDLWDFLVDRLGDEAPWQRVTVNTVAGQDYIDIPSSQRVYRILRLEFAAGGANYWLPVSSLNLTADEIDGTARSWPDARSFRYFARREARSDVTGLSAGSVYGWRFYFSPIPSAVYQLRLYYIPPPVITLDVNTGLFTAFPDEFPEYVIADVCAKMQDKQEADSAPYVAERERIKTRIERYAKPHQMNGPRTIPDMRRLDAGFHDDDDWRRRR